MARNRAVGIVIHNEALLVMHRKNTREYYTFPGGGIEPNETIEDAVQREILEETSITATTDKLLYILHNSNGDNHYYYLCKYIKGTPEVQIGTNEYADNLIGDNLHTPMWLPLTTINDTLLYPEEAKLALLKNLADGFNNSPLGIETNYK